MSLTNNKEKQAICDWAVQNCETVFFGSGDNDSFYADRENEDFYIVEYQFESLPEMKELMNNIQMFGLDPEIKKLAMVSAMKNRLKAESDEKQSNSKDDIPEFIYIFA